MSAVLPKRISLPSVVKSSASKDLWMSLVTISLFLEYSKDLNSLSGVIDLIFTDLVSKAISIKVQGNRRIFPASNLKYPSKKFFIISNGVPLVKILTE